MHSLSTKLEIRTFQSYRHGLNQLCESRYQVNFSSYTVTAMRQPSSMGDLRNDFTDLWEVSLDALSYHTTDLAHNHESSECSAGWLYDGGFVGGRVDK